MDSLTKKNARHFIHENISTILDLKKISLAEIQSPGFKLTLIEVIKSKLASQLELKHLTHEHDFLQSLFDEIVGLGPIEELLKDEQITEVMINGPKQIYIEKNGLLQATHLSYVSEAALRNLINRIVSPLGRRVDESSPMVDARLPDGSRVNAIIPPLSLGGSTLTIRKFSKNMYAPEHFIDQGTLSKKSSAFLNQCVKNKKNILIAGGTGSGKTTLLNLLSSFISPDERIITIEDAAELKLQQKHVITLEARESNIEGKGKVSIRSLLKNALRMRPDRIIVGECRGDETIDMLQAMNTGHEGSITTVHANSARDALSRLEMLVLLSGHDVPILALRQLIATSVDLIVFLKRTRQGQRVISQITEVCGIENGLIVTHDLFKREYETSSLAYSGITPRFFQKLPLQERNEWGQQLQNESDT